MRCYWRRRLVGSAFGLLLFGCAAAPVDDPGRQLAPGELPPPLGECQADQVAGGLGISERQAPGSVGDPLVVLAPIRSLTADGEWLVASLGKPALVDEIRIRRTAEQRLLVGDRLSSTGEFDHLPRWILASVSGTGRTVEVAGDLLWFACDRDGEASNPWDGPAGVSITTLYASVQ